ncbi:MAG: ABC transporter substrate-binding protein [Caldilineaceae bacterium]
MVMERNPYYWEKDENGVQLPYLDAVRFEIIPEDATRILKLQAGEIDGRVYSGEPRGRTPSRRQY